MVTMSDIEHALASPTGERAAATPAHLTAAVVADATRERLLDVRYAVVDAPPGPLVVAATDAGVVRVSFDPPDVAADELARRISPRIMEAPTLLDDVRRELDEYFDGRRTTFDVALDWRLVTGPFSRRVLTRTAAIPYGATSTYADIARDAGNAAASRATGNALGSNPLCILVPCHRVLRSGGGLGGYAGGLPAKRILLDLESA
ncbi:MAG TPA: methylated-DNA--[protein]-cysteine S-methyltransferase [Mycobacteriales bacterium]|nr:methylated-DNA--[protein]-cysteine S-methyltransferase [Mycobacteriales bacterium]